MNRENFTKFLLKATAVLAMICVHSPKERAECLGGVVPIKGGAFRMGEMLTLISLRLFCSLRGMKLPLLWQH